MPRMREAMRSGWKTSSASSRSPVVMNLIGRPVTSRTESTAPPRVSESTFVTTMPVPSTASSKSRASVTASWPVIASTTDQHLGRVDRVGEVGQLVGEVVVEGDHAAGVDDDRARAQPLRLGEGALADLGRRRLLLLDVDGHADLLAEHAQLLAGGRALEVGGDQQRLQPVLFQVLRDARRERGLARALHAADQDLGRPLLRAQQRLLVPPEDLDELLVDGRRSPAGRA